MKVYPRIAFYFICLSGFIGCQADKAIQPTSLSQFQGQWVLKTTTYNPTLRLTLLPPCATCYTEVTTFIATGKAVINSYETKLYISNLQKLRASIDSTINITYVGSSAEVMNAEKEYLAKLASVNAYAMPDSMHLNLFYQSSTIGSGTLDYLKTQ